MPIITVFPDVPRAYSRVDIDWSDTPSVDYARVLRVDVVTGECVPLRPYICFLGDYLNVSCDGHGVFWDTEVPLDRSVYYITEGLDAPCIPADPSIFDTFTRDLIDDWGTTTSGAPYTESGGTVPGDYDVNGGMGRQTLTTVNTRRHAFAFTTVDNQNMYVDTSVPVANATGAGITMWALARLTDVNNWYTARLELSTAGILTLTLAKRVAGTVTDLTAALQVGDSHVANDLWRIRISVNGSLIQGKAWLVADPEPTAWQLSVTDTDLPTGTGVGMASRLETGSADAPLVSSWDNLFVGDPCEPCEPVTASTIDTPVTMPSNGAFRLRDPVRPCNDLYVPMCFTSTPPDCLPTSGIFFASMETESYSANSILLNPTNARRPIAITRQRRDKASLLQLVTRTFTDRDNLLAINEPGSPLLLSGPPQYGIDDAYMSIGTLTIERGLSDHRFPVRINNLPFITVDRPVGPSQGVCGSRVEDTCDLYDTWGELADAGLTFEDIVKGRASDDGGDADAYRTWDEVLAEFTDWDDVEAGGRTWAELEAGD
jgi:hypothetical protein